MQKLLDILYGDNWLAQQRSNGCLELMHLTKKNRIILPLGEDGIPPQGFIKAILKQAGLEKYQYRLMELGRNSN